MIELVIGLVLLTFVILTAYSLLTSGLSDISNTRDYSVATLLCQEAIEACKGYKFDLLDKDDFYIDINGNVTTNKNGNKSLEWDLNNDDGTPNDKYKHKIDIGGMKFTRTVNIDQVDRNIPSGIPSSIKSPKLKLKAVKVNVKWKNKQNRNIEYEVDTLVSSIYK